MESINDLIALIKTANLFDEEGDYSDADAADAELASELGDFFQIMKDDPKAKISDAEINRAKDRAMLEYDLRKHLHSKGQPDPLFDDEGPSDEQLQDIEGQRLIEGW